MVGWLVGWLVAELHEQTTRPRFFSSLEHVGNKYNLLSSRPKSSAWPLCDGRHIRSYFFRRGQTRAEQLLTMEPPKAHTLLVRWF